MKKNPVSACVATLLLCATLVAQSGKLPDAEFRKVAQSHGTADEHQRLAAHYTAHAVEHEDLAKEHAGR